MTFLLKFKPKFSGSLHRPDHIHGGTLYELIVICFEMMVSGENLPKPRSRSVSPPSPLPLKNLHSYAKFKCDQHFALVKFDICRSVRLSISESDIIRSVKASKHECITAPNLDIERLSGKVCTPLQNFQM